MNQGLENPRRSGAVLHRLGFLLDGLTLVEVTACVSPEEAAAFCGRLESWRSSLPELDRLRTVHARPAPFTDERTAASPQKLLEDVVRDWGDPDLLDTSAWWRRQQQQASGFLPASGRDSSQEERVLLRWSFVWNRGGEDDEATEYHVAVHQDDLEKARDWVLQLGAEMESQGLLLGACVQRVLENASAAPVFCVGLTQLAAALRREDHDHPWVPALREWALALERHDQAPAVPLSHRARPRA